MWKIIYNLLTLCALPFFLVIGMNNRKMKINFRQRLVPVKPEVPGTGACMLHGASIGEAVMACNIADHLEKHYGIHHFLFTTNTSYAQEMLEKKQSGIPDRNVACLPFDLFFSVKRFLDHYRPSALIIVETEIWPNLIWQANRRGIPVIIINGRISDSTLANYRRLSVFMRSALAGIDAVIAQSDEHRKRFISIGMARGSVFVAGNIKYYRPATGIKTDISSRKNAVTFGSVKEKELAEIYRAITLISGDHPGFSFFIAPREIHLSDTIEKDLSGTFRTVRYSQLKQGLEAEHDIIIVDTIGDLMSVYESSLIAFVGGSLAPYGGQNMLEPLFVGTPVLFGPHTENFKDVAAGILEKKAGFLVSDGSDINSTIRMLLTDSTLYSATQKAGRAIIADQQHVMDKCAQMIVDVINKKKRGSSGSF